MEKKLPGIFANKIEKPLNNNETVYYGNRESVEEVVEKIEKKGEYEPNIRQKIHTIFNSVNYIYKIDVEITFADKKEVKKIIGYNELYIITFDNELIPIQDIVDIQIKK